MTTKVVEVLTKILEGLNKNYSLEDVSETLSKEKQYDKQTVSVAFSLIYDKIVASKHSGEKEKNAKRKNIRILSEDEIAFVGLKQYNYLIYLQNIGLIDSYDLENLLEQILTFQSSRITFEDINWMVLVSLVDYDSKVLPGSRVTLFSTDTIN